MITDWKELLRSLNGRHALFLRGDQWKLFDENVVGEVEEIQPGLVEALTRIGLLKPRARCYDFGQSTFSNLRNCCAERKLTLQGRIVRDRLAVVNCS